MELADEAKSRAVK